MGLDLLPPWDQIPYFQPPVTSIASISGVGVTKVQLVESDPMRVLLVISLVSSSQTALVLPSQSVNALGPGILLTSGTPFIEIDQARYGPLVASEWWMAASMGVSASIVSISMKEWPSVTKRRKKTTVPRPDSGNGWYNFGQDDRP